MTTAVLERATVKPSSTATPRDQPNSIDNASMAPVLAPICNRVASAASFHRRRNERRDSSMPMTKSSSSTPSSARMSMWARFSTTAKADGPSKAPATM